MRPLLYFLFGIFFLTVSFKIKSKKEFIPPGTVQINDTLFADEVEISNFSWQEYEMWTKSIYGANSKEHLATLPDTLVWREKNSSNEPYVQYYYRHKAYWEFPVVGISYNQALAYSKWRTDRVKAFMTLKKDFKHENFEYRLPTKMEWERLAEFSTRTLKNNGKNKKGEYQINCVHPDTIGTSYPDVTVPVRSYSKSLYGLYNILGNVAEMVQEKGICKGGCWRNNIEECLVGKDYHYTKQNAMLGFRCVCVVKKKSNC
ncbi:MAG: SUMF1/EgtB/PvdO family nonheme iron enzyme [Bacteroidota bacterium]